ncbi:carboxypeptidase regulatory-like domain-containing protein [Pyxidicoccus sp. MSG2]|uniref:carboxypeptidase regulatory-like domain-containing protein n=1 Tax=Pyxidicoccus sp. MSG2 TaxID=2996790 RepID=UPI00226EC2E8|nr:carboxypeptidase regulatory-like domain-containing protein [Pyxidicoccus sp. MSG2]MCY1019262.1 carboxypeptidase regulatory-like domain-containing protein [Pyxidicoccus sp. MSG2]
MRTRHWLWGSVVVGALVLVTWALPGGGWRGATSARTQAVRNAGTPHASRAAATASQRPSAGLRISGTVVDTKGVPVAGVRVSASSPEPGQTLSEMPCPEHPPWAFQSPLRQNARSRRLPQCIDDAGDLVIELVGAREGEAPIHAETTTGADGAFVLEALPEGVMTLWALGERGAASRSGIPAGSEGVALELEAGILLQGTVMGGGTPLAGANVTALDMGRSRFFDATTGTDGGFRMGPVPYREMYLAVVAKEGWLPAYVGIGDLHKQVTLLRPSRLSGRVLSNGVPAPGAEVRRVPGKRLPVAGDDARGITADAEGRFEWVLPPGEYTLSASRGERYALARVTAGPTTPEVVLELGSALHVEGTVSDESGQPVAGATVSVSRQESNGASLRALTGPEGHYRMGPLESGEWDFAVTAPGHLDRWRMEPQTLGPTTGPVDFTLHRAASITGRVTDTEGRPLSGIQLVPQRADTEAEDTGAREHAWTDEEGCFVLDTEEPGDYRIIVTDKSFLNAAFRVRAPSRDVHLTLKPGASVEGTVEDAHGVRLEGFLVELQDPEGLEEWRLGRDVRTDEKGHFLIQGVPPGRYLLLATREAASATRRVWRGVELQAGTRAQVPLRLEPERTLSGIVVDVSGQPVKDVYVRARPPQRDGPFWKQEGRNNRHGTPMGVRTEAEGRFTLRALTEAAYDVSAWKSGYTLDRGLSTGGTAAEEDMLRVGADTAQVRLVLRREAHIVGRLVGPDGAPIPRFQVNGTRTEDPEGAFAVPVEDLPSEPLVFEAEGLATRVLRWEPGASGADLDLGVVRMSRGRGLHGRVVDAETGEPLADVGFEFSTRSMDARGDAFTLSNEGTEGTKEDGTFDLPHVDLEAFTLTATCDGYRKQRLTVGPEQEEVLLRMDPGARVEVTVKDRRGRLRDATVEFHGDGVEELGLTQKGQLVQRGLEPGPYTVWLSLHDSLDSRTPVFPPQRVVVPASGRVRVSFQEQEGGATVKLRGAGGDDVSVMLLPGSVPPPSSSEDLERLSAHSIDVEQRGDEATFQQVPQGVATVLIVQSGDSPRFHSEELVIPSGGTLSRNLSPVWRSFDVDSED